MQIIGLVIGRGNNTLPDKNIRLVKGVPLLMWGVRALRKCSGVSNIFVSTECPKIKKISDQWGIPVINRPNELSNESSSSSDVVRHAAETLGEEFGIDFDLLVLVHGNVGTISGDQIKQAIDVLINNPSLSSVIPVHTNPEYSPYRCFKEFNGTLSPFVKNEAISPNRQDNPTVYFPNHSFWCLTKRGIFQGEFGPWPCWGNSIGFVEQPGSFDVHSEEDLIRTENWLDEQKVDY